MFLRNAWYVAATSSELTDKPLARTLLNEPVALFRNAQGEAFALEDRCCHRGAPLSLGWQSDKGVVCGYHGLVFDRTGRCVEVPGSRGRIPPEAKVRSYPVVEKTDQVWIWMGDPSKADAMLIVDYPPDDPVKLPRQQNMLHIKATYVMVLDNLMDLSHLSYLHRDSIGSAPEDSEKAQMDVERTPTGVRFLRVMRNAKTPALFRKTYGLGERSDRWSDFEYVAPACIRQYTGSVNAGEYDQGRRDGFHLSRTLHAVTPETERSCFYFFNVADGFAPFAPPGYRRMPLADVFSEDAFMLERQQERLEGYDTERLINIPSDIARVHMIRHLKQRIADEHNQTGVTG